MPALRAEPADRGGYHRMRLDANSAPGAQRSTRFPPLGSDRTHSDTGANGAPGSQRQVRALQDYPPLRRHLAEPAIARLSGQNSRPVQEFTIGGQWIEMKESPSSSSTGCFRHLSMRLRKIFGLVGHLVPIVH